MSYCKVKKLIKQIGFSLCLILPAQSQEFTVGWELWYPYQFHNNNNELAGVDIEIFNLIAKKMDIKISYVELPWQRHLMYIKSGVIDIAFGASYTKEREQTAYFSIPYRKESVSLFVKKGTAQTIKLEKLSELIDTDYLIGVENGYYYGDEFLQLKSNPDFMSKIHGVLDIEQNVKMLLKGYLDGFLSDPIAMQAFVKKYKLEGRFEAHSLPIYQSDIYIMLSKKNHDLKTLDKINDAILSLKQSGKLADIIKQGSVTY